MQLQVTRTLRDSCLNMGRHLSHLTSYRVGGCWHCSSQTQALPLPSNLCCVDLHTLCCLIMTNVSKIHILIQDREKRRKVCFYQDNKKLSLSPSPSTPPLGSYGPELSPMTTLQGRRMKSKWVGCLGAEVYTQPTT